jgi:hypothetical protein
LKNRKTLRALEQLVALAGILFDDLSAPTAAHALQARRRWARGLVRTALDVAESLDDEANLTHSNKE